jgi:hypothetical protein
MTKGIYKRPSAEERFWAKVKKTLFGCWEWQGGCTTGYGAFWLGSNNIGAHIFSWVLKYGPIPEGLCVLHKCDNKRCVRPSHLFLGTNADNTKDMMQKGRGRFPVGEQHGQAKLTEASVLEARRLAKMGISLSAIARKYKVHPTTMWWAVKGVTWKHVPM